jgi:short-subunit dehydrogenase
MTKKSPKHTWIIGASTGIGEALAIELARRGEIIALSSRNGEALEAVRTQLKGRDHLVLPFDASDPKAIQSNLDHLMSHWGRIDRIIFMAGLYTPMKTGEIDMAEAEKIIRVNLFGALAVAESSVKALTAQGYGQLVLTASVAGYRGLPNAQPYGATKAALINLAQSLACEHRPLLDIKVINPGFVKSRLTDKNDFEMPFRISATKAARYIAGGLKSKAFEIHFPKRFTLIMKFLQILPDGLYFSLLSKKAN